MAIEGKSAHFQLLRSSWATWTQSTRCSSGRNVHGGASAKSCHVSETEQIEKNVASLLHSDGADDLNQEVSSALMRILDRFAKAVIPKGIECIEAPTVVGTFATLNSTLPVNVQSWEPDLRRIGAPRRLKSSRMRHVLDRKKYAVIRPCRLYQMSHHLLTLC